MIISVAHRPTNVNRKTTRWITMQTTNFDENQYFANSHHCNQKSAIERDKMLQTIDLWMWPILHRYFLFKAEWTNGSPSFFETCFVIFWVQNILPTFSNHDAIERFIMKKKTALDKVNFFLNIKQFLKIIFDQLNRLKK